MLPSRVNAASGAFEFKDNGAVNPALYPAARERWTTEIAQKPLELLWRIRWNTRRCVNLEAITRSEHVLRRSIEYEILRHNDTTTQRHNGRTAERSSFLDNWFKPTDGRDTRQDSKA
ncbi:MAG: hypothetical protein ACI9OJ_001094 [Myxococcota bacterium]|jgi:hypothetical protein